MPIHEGVDSDELDSEELGSEELEAFQAVLLDMLERAVPPAALKAELLKDPAAAPFRDYVESFEPRCLAVASRIIGKWALRRTKSSASSSGIGRAKK
jgi:hypothetical protein